MPLSAIEISTTSGLANDHDAPSMWEQIDRAETL